VHGPDYRVVIDRSWNCWMRTAGGVTIEQNRVSLSKGMTLSISGGYPLYKKYTLSHGAIPVNSCHPGAGLWSMPGRQEKLGVQESNASPWRVFRRQCIPVSSLHSE
jgi:hypothetical protein